MVEAPALVNVTRSQKDVSRLIKLFSGDQEIEINERAQTQIPVDQLDQGQAFKNDDRYAGLGEDLDQFAQGLREVTVMISGAVGEHKKPPPYLRRDEAWAIESL